MVGGDRAPLATARDVHPEGESRPPLSTQSHLPADSSLSRWSSLIRALVTSDFVS